jgi:hypothetical protein
MPAALLVTGTTSTKMSIAVASGVDAAASASRRRFPTR